MAFLVVCSGDEFRGHKLAIFFWVPWGRFSSFEAWTRLWSQADQKMLTAKWPAGSLVLADALHFHLGNRQSSKIRSGMNHTQQWGDLYEFVIFSCQMGAATAPFIISRIGHQFCSDRVEFNMPNRCQQIFFIHDKRWKPALPQIPPPSLPKIDHSRIPAMRFADGGSQVIGFGGYGNQMGVILNCMPWKHNQNYQRWKRMEQWGREGCCKLYW